MRTIHVSIKGIVQGVGFRPFVYTLAVKHALSGKVWNTSGGVEIVASGAENSILAFLQELQQNPPALARIDQFEAKTSAETVEPGFKIIESQSDANAFIPISPDVCICEDCRKELFDPNNRRYRYPFINCTNCGPRLTIIKDIPYDRPKTTMAGFPLCPDCQAEYDNPLDRRFHAQPVACEKCGPVLSFRAPELPAFYGEEALQTARRFLREGKILAIKGLGGYHIACDAANLSAVEKLIQRKHRSEKPLALMAFDIDTIKKYCEVSPEESELLHSPQHPIVLLKKGATNLLPEAVALRQTTLGFMLPYTPLHLLLLEKETGFPEVLVMTSGNLSEEPIAFEDEDALERLSPLVDGFLTHNRGINIRVDDSVLRVFNGKPFFLRRARGYAPDPIRLPFEVPEMLTCGAELKNTFCLSKANYAFLSHHIGDLENYESLASFTSGIEHYQKLFRVTPRTIIADLHPDYLSTKYAIDRAERTSLSLLQVQHHHAHLAACLADNNCFSDEPVIGCIFDGTGYGTDGNIWGGEFFVGAYSGFARVSHLAAVPLPGGDASIKHPLRIGLSYLHAAGIGTDEALAPYTDSSLEIREAVLAQITRGINAPLTTSMGRLFDAVAAIVGIRQHVSYEAQAAMELEACCDPFITEWYPFELIEKEINVFPAVRAIVNDLKAGTDNSTVAAKFHNTVAQICLQACHEIRTRYAISTVALSGGVWQNTTLLAKTIALLKADGFKVLIHHQVPTNDGGIALGQLMVAAFTRKE